MLLVGQKQKQRHGDGRVNFSLLCYMQKRFAINIISPLDSCCSVAPTGEC